MNHLRIGLFGFLSIVSACGTDASPIASTLLPDGSPTMAGEVSAGTAVGTKTIALEGTVVDEAGVRVFGRPVIVIDAQSHVTSMLTDDGGTFHVADVVPPYDVSIDGSPSSKAPMTSVWLGVSRADPRFDVIDRDARSAEPAAAKVRVDLQVPPCMANRCWIAVATASASGRGQAAGSYGVNQTRCELEVVHTFHLGSPDGEERLALHALSGDEGFGSYAFADVSTRIEPGTRVDLGDIPLVPIETTSPVTISVRGDEIPQDWRWTLATEAVFGDGAVMTLQYAQGPALVTRAPFLANASLAIGAWAEAPPDPSSLGQAASFAWSGRVALTSRSVVLDLAPPVVLTEPTKGGVLSRQSGVFRWVSHGGTASLVVSDLSRGRPWARVHASGNEVDLARLVRLGIASPEPGDYLVELGERVRMTIDDVVSASEPLSGLQVDSPFAGASAHQQIAFTVTP